MRKGLQVLEAHGTSTRGRLVRLAAWRGQISGAERSKEVSLAGRGAQARARGSQGPGGWGRKDPWTRGLVPIG